MQREFRIGDLKDLEFEWSPSEGSFDQRLRDHQDQIKRFLRERTTRYPYADGLLVYRKNTFDVRCVFDNGRFLLVRHGRLVNEMDLAACMVASKRFIREVTVAQAGIPGVIRGLNFGVLERDEFFHALEIPPYGSLDSYTTHGVTALKQEIRNPDGTVSYVPYDFDYCDLFIWIHHLFVTLEQLSKKKLIHRDIKPENIWINKDLIPVISELEFARPEMDDQTSAGTLYWAAREVVEAALDQAKRNPDLDATAVFQTCATAKSDIYSASLLVYHLCIGNFTEVEWDLSVDGVGNREKLREDMFERLDIRNVSKISRQLADIDTPEEEGSPRFSHWANEHMRKLIAKNCDQNPETRNTAEKTLQEIETIMNELIHNSRNTARWYASEYPDTERSRQFLAKAQEYSRKWANYRGYLMREKDGPAKPHEGSFGDMQTAAHCGSITAMAIMFLYRVKNNIHDANMDMELKERLESMIQHSLSGFGANLLDGFTAQFAIDVMERLSIAHLTESQTEVTEQCRRICMIINKGDPEGC